MIRTRLIGAALASLFVVGVGEARADVSVEITPPSVAFEAAPPLVEVSPGVQVVQGYDDEIFVVDGVYYMRRHHRWFRADGWDGGWAYCEPGFVPRPIFAMPYGRYRYWGGRGHGWEGRADFRTSRYGGPRAVGGGRGVGPGRVVAAPGPRVVGAPPAPRARVGAPAPRVVNAPGPARHEMAGPGPSPREVAAPAPAPRAVAAPAPRAVAAPAPRPAPAPMPAARAPGPAPAMHGGGGGGGGHGGGGHR